MNAGILIFLGIHFLIPLLIGKFVRIGPWKTLFIVQLGYCYLFLTFMWSTSGENPFLTYLVAVGLYAFVPGTLLVFFGTALGIGFRKKVSK